MTSRYPIGASLLLCAFAQAFAKSLPDNCVILPESEGHNTVVQCSRVSPERVTAFWTPSIEEVLNVEQRLPALLKASKLGRKIRLSHCRRQYIGVVSSDRRLIYVNAFSSSEPNPFFQIDWRSAAFSACDGGPEFWGVAFDPVTGKFLYLGFNGTA